MSDMYRVSVVRDGVRRITDLDRHSASFTVREAVRSGYVVSSVLLPKDAELIRGVIEESVDVVSH